jgi:hypothetical protein
MSVSKTVSIPEDLGHQHDWRTCRSRRGILDASRKFWQKILSGARLLILTDSSQKSFSRFWSLFLEHSEDGPHTLLNGGLKRISITLTWNCCRDLLNLCLQHLIEAQLVLRCYCEVVHLGIDVLQELISGMNLFANFIIYPYLIPDDIFKLVNLAGVGLSVLLIPALVRGHLLNQFMSFHNTESEERTSSSNIYYAPGLSESTHDRSFG